MVTECLVLLTYSTVVKSYGRTMKVQATKRAIAASV
jgi:hypothetical protein